MKGHGPRLVPTRFQLHELADDLTMSAFISNAIDDVVWNHQSSATVTPAPPSFQAPRRNCFHTRPW
jgi:hypothetical protein